MSHIWLNTRTLWGALFGGCPGPGTLVPPRNPALGLLYIKHRKFTCVLYAHFRFLCSLARFNLANRGVRQPAQPHTFCAPLLVFDKTSVQAHFAVANCSDAVMSVLYCPVCAQPDIFAVKNCCVVALSVFSSDILTWSADSLYSVQ